MIRLGLVVVWALAGCAGFIEKRAADSTYTILEKSQIAARRQADVQIAREAVPGGLLQLEAFTLAYPDHPGFKTLHVEALCQYVSAFVFDDWEAASFANAPTTAQLADRVTRLAVQCADKNLARLPVAWRTARTAGEEAWRAQLARATKAETPALLWIATTDALQLALAPLVKVGTLPAIEATLERVIALAPGAHESDAELLLGTLQAGKSRFLGGPDGSALFASAKKQLGAGALIADVMFARGVAVAKADRALFTQTLEAVLAADVTAFPERRLANELARIKAQRYLAAIDTLIPAR